MAEFSKISLNGTTYTVKDAYAREIVKKYVIPESYGAVGDGATDDSAALASASEDGIILSNGKTYYVGSSITMKNGSVGANYKLASDATIVATESAEWRNNTFSLQTGATVSGRGVWMLVVRNAPGSVIEDNEFYGSSNCLYLDRINSGKVVNNYFHDIPQTAAGSGGNGYGVLTVECKDIEISGNDFVNVARHSIYISHDDTSTLSENTNIHHNNFSWDANVSGNTTGFETTIMVRPTKNIIIHHNIFSSLQTGVTFTHQEILGTVVGTSNATVSDNTFNSISNNVTSRKYDGIINIVEGTYTVPSVDGLIIARNTCNDCLSPILRGRIIKNTFVRDNIIMNNPSDKVYEIFIPDNSTTQHPIDLHIINNSFDYVSAYWLHYSGTISSKTSFGDLEIIGNSINSSYFMDCPTNTAFDKYTVKDNVISVDHGDFYTNNFDPGYVIASGNASNTPLSWRASFTASKILDWDNVLARPDISLFGTNIRRGATIEGRDGYLYHVNINGSLTKIANA